MKILFVFTGGTIGSAYNGDIISLNAKMPYALIDEYSKKYPIDFDFDVISPYSVLSENNTGLEISSLINTIARANGFDGIVIAHGTDTLQYTAAALGYFFGNSCNPICVISSNYPLSDIRANGLYNLHSAISLIKLKSEKGVFAAYKNSDDNKTVLHRASRLLSHDAFSDSLRSARGAYYGFFDESGDFVKNTDFTEKPDTISAPVIKEFSAMAERILLISSHVGMTYPSLDGIEYVLIDSYHSGTVDTASNQAKSFYLDAIERNIRVFLSGAYDGAQYQSTKEFDSLSIIPIPNIAPIALYVKLWLYSQNCIVDKELLLSSRGGDVIDFFS